MRLMEAAADRCGFTARSGHRAGSQCNRTARFTVTNEAAGSARERVCGRHIGPAVECHSNPQSPLVLVVPDFYNDEER